MALLMVLVGWGLLGYGFLCYLSSMDEDKDEYDDWHNDSLI
jgi:hypothetical protein